MAKKLDLGKVEAALKRAAQAAISGRREERAGRFIAQRHKPKSGSWSASKAARKEK
jgi:hypothetical protein